MTTIGMSAGQKLVSKVSGGQLGSYPSFGLAMRFSVVVDDLPASPGVPSDGTNLGLWQSCRGLQVELKYKPVEEGGQYTYQTMLPDRLSYGRITLERAVNTADSTTVQTWLQKYVRDWQYYPTASDSTPLSTNLVITLLDYQLNKVMSWKLWRARPCKWTGPTLSGTDNKVATESIEFEHEGFLSEPA